MSSASLRACRSASDSSSSSHSKSAALGGLLLGGGGLDGDAVGTGDDRLVELETLGAGVDHGDGGVAGGDGGQHGALTGARRRGDGGLGRACALRGRLGGRGLRRGALAGRSVPAGAVSSAVPVGTAALARGARVPAAPSSSAWSARGGCFRCWLVGGHSGSFPCWVRSPGDRLVPGQRLRPSSRTGEGPGSPARRFDRWTGRGCLPAGGRRAGALSIVTTCAGDSTASDPHPRLRRGVPRPRSAGSPSVPHRPRRARAEVRGTIASLRSHPLRQRLGARRRPARRPTMPASFSSSRGDDRGAGGQQRHPLVGLLAHPAADDDQVRPEPGLEDVEVAVHPLGPLRGS